jgi:hypothetical protein
MKRHCREKNDGMQGQGRCPHGACIWSSTAQLEGADITYAEVRKEESAAAPHHAREQGCKGCAKIPGGQVRVAGQLGGKGGQGEVRLGARGRPRLHDTTQNNMQREVGKIGRRTLVPRPVGPNWRADIDDQAAMPVVLVNLALIVLGG